MPPAPAYLDGAFSPRKLGKGQVEQELGWGRCGADPGKPRTSPCARQCLPAGGDAAPGTHIPTPPGFCLRPGIPGRHRCPPVRRTAAFAPVPCWLPILNPGAEKRAPWGCSTSYVASPATRLWGFPPHPPPKSQTPNISEHQLPARKQAGLRQPLPPPPRAGKAALPDLWCSKWCLT